MRWLTLLLYYVGSGLGIVVFLGLMLKVGMNLAASIQRTRARSGGLPFSDKGKSNP